MLGKYIAVTIFIALASGQRRRPNILLLVTDDQDVMLGSMDVMDYVKQTITEQGVEFTNAFTTTPICCPSRSSILTGLYAHNHHVYTNNDNCSSVLWQRFYETKSYATYLRNTGYHTGYFGKYLNEYNGSYTPPGWDYWMGLVKNSKYYNYTLLHNGRKEVHGANYQEDYLTDLVTNRSIEFFRQAKSDHPETPVLSVVSFPAPHGPEDSAPQYQGLYQDPSSHETQSFDYVPNPDKHWIVRQRIDKMDGDQYHFSKLLQQKRLQTLRSVDDNIRKLVDMLQEMQELDNTYILYFSDHGYHIGQFGLAKGKSQPYDFDIRIPFLLRGPGIPRNKQLPKIALNIDIAPTILGIAGVPIPDEMDGRNLLDLFNDNKLAVEPWRDSFLLEKGKMQRNKTHLVKPRIRTKVERLAKLCESPNYVNPCLQGQYWTCVIGADNKRRLQKCKKEKKPSKQKTRPRKRKLCPCPENHQPWNSAISSNDEVNVLQTCRRRFPSSAFRNSRSRSRSRLSKRNSYHQFYKDIEDRTLRGYNKLRKEKTFNKRRYKRGAPELNNGGGRSRSSSMEKRSSMVLTSSCRLYMPNFEIRCMEDLYNDPHMWVKHMGHLARSVKTLQLKMKYMKTLRTCLNAYDEMIKSGSQMCECPPQPSRPRVTKPRTDPRLNFSHPLFDLSTQEDVEFNKQKKIYEEQRETVRLIKDIRQAKLQKHAQRERRGKMRVKRCGLNGVTCFVLSNQTWATEPRWERENQCYCTNSNNNTYWCVRIINEDTNVLYCQWVTGHKEYYDMKMDPNQLLSREVTLSEEEKSMYQDMLGKLRGCKGSRNCTLPEFLNHYARTLNIDGLQNAGNVNDTSQEEPPQEGDPNELDLASDPAEAVPSAATTQGEVDLVQHIFDSSLPQSPRNEQRESNRRTSGTQAKGTRQRKRQGGSRQNKMASQGRSGRKALQRGQAERPKKKQTSQETSSPEASTRSSQEEEPQGGRSSQRSRHGRRRNGRARHTKTQKNTRSKEKNKLVQ